MVSRKPLPQSYSPAGVGGSGSDGIPDILRPGGGRTRPQSPSSSTPSQDAPNAPNVYANFESGEQSVWRQQGYQPQPQQQPQASIPTILLQTATGSSSASAFSDSNPFKRKALGNGLYAASPTSLSSSMASPSELSQPQPHSPSPSPSQNQNQPPTDSFAQLRMGDQPAQNPWQPGSFDNSRTNHASSPSPLPTIVDDGEAEGSAGANAWAAQAHAMASGGPPPVTKPPVGAGAGAANFRNSNLISFPPDEELDNADWSDVASPSQPSAVSSSVVSAAPPPRPPFTPLDGKEAETTVFEDSHAWDDVGGKAASQPQAVPLVAEATGEGWSLVDTEPVPGQLSRQSTWEAFSDDDDENKGAKKQAEKPSAKPGSGAGATSAQNTSAQNGNVSQPQQPVAAYATSRKAKGKAVDEALVNSDSLSSGSQPSAQLNDPISSAPITTPTSSQRQDTSPANNDHRPQLPPRSMLDIDSVPPPAQPPRPVDASKTETYQVKLINWYDARAAQNPRTSPILVQNANGPCPLVALVNALTLTTPADTKTALVEALRTREQVSLDLLLGNVFDELMSRRSGSEINLPDIDELYKFLKGLDRGMTVNPRYIPTPEVVAAFRRTSRTHRHPRERKEMIPGTFEDTREMQLYATFSIPLIHGWLPAKDEPAYDALSRRAASYEDVQNLLFREEELEEKLTSPHNEDGLSLEEQGLYQDILEIKTFLHVSATQLTAFGLDVLSKAMLPGSFAILFRNDHFATLYLHPDTMQLMSLVTDAGYATHDEVVWETLVDVNGERTAYFSGDFRLVGSGSGSGSGSTSRSRHGRSESHSGGHSGGPSTTSAVAADDEQLRHEQEDRDLALALQLQEEEEAQQREDEARRQSRLSEQYIEQNGRRSSAAAGAGAAGTTAAQGQGRLPRNAAGGGRYASSAQSASSHSSPSLHQPPVLPRRSSAGSALTAGAAATTTTTGRRPTPQQVVRPLVPPAATTTTATSNMSARATRIVNGRPAVHRAADGDAGDDADAPPSYEHAAMLAPYHPPPGAPGSETATLCGTPSNTSINTNSGNSGPAASQQQPGTSMGYATPSGRPYVAPGGYGQQPGMAGNRNDRECIVM